MKLNPYILFVGDTVHYKNAGKVRQARVDSVVEDPKLGSFFSGTDLATKKVIQGPNSDIVKAERTVAITRLSGLSVTLTDGVIVTFVDNLEDDNEPRRPKGGTPALSARKRRAAAAVEVNTDDYLEPEDADAIPA